MIHKIRGLLFVVMMILPLFVLTVRGATVGAPCTLIVHWNLHILELTYPLEGIVTASSDGTFFCEPVNADPMYPAVPCGTTIRPFFGSMDARCPY
ncbi:MAG TPA: hypothetical protein VJ302_35030 [Blastocatellia bacterium]|nr:hypothetical protein [Blastocatellia bacterium]